VRGDVRRLVVIHYPFFGGPHNQALRLNEPLEQCGICTTVVLPHEPGNAAGRLREAQIDVEEIELHRIRARFDPRLHARLLTGFWGDVQRLRRIISMKGVDLVEIAGLVNSQAAVAARLERVAVVWQLVDTRAPRVATKVLMSAVTQLADVVMSTGMRVADAHPGARALGDRLVPFFPPVDTSAFRPSEHARAAAREELGLDPAAPVVGSVANITRQKGIEHFVRLARLVCGERPEARFVLFGRVMETQRDYAADVFSEARQLMERGQLLVRDPNARVKELLPALDVFVMTSVARSEGIATALLEAMACGIPTVATNVGALSEAVVEGKTGYLVEPVDVERLARHVVSYIDHPVLRAEAGAAGRKLAVARYDVRACAEVHLSAYRRALTHRHTPSRNWTGCVSA
jgi:glycosyltransferase involved in cell wall biosynthesis